jgi:dienelactone hydrolase
LNSILDLNLPRRIASILSSVAAAVALPAALLMPDPACAQKEFPPPQGKGRVVVVASGMSGPSHSETVSKEIAQLGYDVMLFDGNAMENTNGGGLRAAIQQAQQAPHGLPGKVAVVGFSLGRGMALYYGVQMPETVAGVVAWYPATSFIKNIPGWVNKVKVPVLMFAGEKDTFRDGCCLVQKAHVLDDAAKAGGLDFQLFTYPNTDHGFVKGGEHYNAASDADAMAKTAAKLKLYLGEPGS